MARFDIKELSIQKIKDWVGSGCGNYLNGRRATEFSVSLNAGFR